MRERLQVAFFGAAIGAITGVIFAVVFSSDVPDWVVPFRETAWVALAITLLGLVAGACVIYHNRKSHEQGG